MRGFDFSSWQSILLTLIGVALFALISIGIRLLMMFTIQQRRERMNRQINERLRTLISAYKILGGSFTGNLTVDPTHLRDRRQNQPVGDGEPFEGNEAAPDVEHGSDRRRRIRDSVEAALSDIILLGTEEQVRLAERAVREMIAGRSVRTHELVVSLRNFIREALDLAPVPPDLQLPDQGPTRPASAGSRGKGEREHGGTRGGGGTGAGAGGGGAGAGFMIGGAGGSREDGSA